MDGCPSDAKELIMKLREMWGHGSAKQLRREFAHAGGDSMHLVNYAGAALERCAVCRAFDKAARAF